MRKRLILSSLIILLIFIFINSTYLVPYIINYTKTFINSLFFYTFIIYIISSLLIDNDLLSILSPIKYITLMSMISGFPSSSKYINELLRKDYIDLDTSRYLITYTHYPNPLFVTSSISTIIGIKYSLLILLSIYISSFITSRLFKNNNLLINKKYSFNNISFSNSLNNAITNSIKTICIIYGTSIFFVIISFIITNIFKLDSTSYSIVCGIFDLTNGIFSTNIINNKRISTLLILLFINIGSISIHLQVKQILNNNTLYKYFLKGRIISTSIAVIILIIGMLMV